MAMLSVRPFRPDELPVVMERGLRSAWDQLSGRERPAARPGNMAHQLQGMYRMVLATPGAALLVAEWAGAGSGVLAVGEPGPVGHALLFPQPNPFTAQPEVVVMDIWVQEALRGRGIGKALLAAAEQHARGLGAGGLAAQIALHNGASRTLFGRAGFQEERVVVGRGW